MADKETLTVDQIDEDWQALKTWPGIDSQSLIRLADIFDMARRFATEMPKLEADLTKQTIKANYLEGEFGDLLKERDQLETQLATATAQVEQLREALERLTREADNALASDTEHVSWVAINNAKNVISDLHSTNTEKSDA